MRPVPMTSEAGVAIMAAAMLIAPFMDAMAKLATEAVSPGETALGRFAAQSVFLLPVVILSGQWRRPGWVHVAAGGLLGTALLFITAALEVMPVANTLAIFFVEPLILTLLSAAFLGERLGWRRLSAVGAGLVGAMVVIRPNWAAFGLASVYPLVTAVAFACFLLIMRRMSPRGGRIALQFWIGVFAMLGLGGAGVLGSAAGIAPLALSWPPLWAVGLMAAMGAISGISHQMLSAAFARAEAGVLAPLQYLEIISATFIGWAVWNDFPDRLTWAGTAIIVAAGVYVFRRERQLARLAAARR